MLKISDFENDFQSKSAQENLIAYLRHELRTPINAIIGYSEMLLEDAIDENNSLLIEELQKVHIGGRQLLSTVNIVLKTNTGSLYSSLKLNQILESLCFELLPPLKEVLENTETLLNKTEQKTITADLEKIYKSSEAFKKMLDNLAAVVQAYVNSLPKNETDSKTGFQVNVTQSRLEAGVNQGDILIVDDNINNIDLLTRYLTRQGHKVTSAMSGAQAIEKLSLKEYDLVLLDLIMPETNGYQLLVKLKADKKTQHIPVIMISALDEMKSVVSCIEEGAEDYLSKPFDPILLKARIDSCLEKKRLRDAEKQYVQILNKEFEKGIEIQKNFLPESLLSKPGWEFETFFRPARQMAGDFYDMFELGENQIGLVIADVCDKGIGAALFMGLFRSLIRIFSGQTFLEGLNLLKHEALQTNECITEVMPNHLNALAAISMTNNYIAKNHGEMGMFATLFFGVLDLLHGQLTYINGGHEPLFIINSQGKIKEKLSSTAPAVGMLPDLNFKIKQTMLEAGDMLFGYTDGVPEAKSASGQFFSDKTLLSLLELPMESASGLINLVSEKVLAHMGTEEQFDDITMLAVRRFNLGE